MMRFLFIFFFINLINFLEVNSQIVQLGVDNLFEKEYSILLKNKKIGLITNHTAINKEAISTINLLRNNEKLFNYTLKALFAPEHGLNGSAYANVKESKIVAVDHIPVHFLYGKTARISKEMLEGLDLLIFDIQDVGVRSYTYSATLFYTMEEAAKANIPVIVLDRPNPINGITIDGPMLNEHFRSMVGYINVPYCHGMTIGELAQYFNAEYKVGCALTVIPMKGWNRAMTFNDTGLNWVPTSPQIPEATTAYFYPITGVLGEISLLNIGVGYTLPFKIVGAPWIDSVEFAKELNKHKFPGVYFEPFHFRPFYGKYAREECGGVLIFVTDHKIYKPVSTQYLILGTVKNLYPQKFKEALDASSLKRYMFHRVNGTDEIFNIIQNNKHVIWPLCSFQRKEREIFSLKRKKYLIPSYNMER